MVGKAIIPGHVHAKIRELSGQGVGRKAIAEHMSVSNYTVRRALDEGFAEREAARQRENYPDRYEHRKDDPHYQAYQAEYDARPERREQVRDTMRRLRAYKKTLKQA